MNTHFIGIKDFRANIADYATRARAKKARYIVVSRNKPLFEVLPFSAHETLDTLFSEITKAEKDIQAGKFYTQKQIEEEFA